MGKAPLVQNPDTVQIDKKCSCGKTHATLTNDAVVLEGLVWFNCSCESTLVVKSQVLNEKAFQDAQSYLHIARDYEARGLLTSARIAREVAQRIMDLSDSLKEIA